MGVSLVSERVAEKLYPSCHASTFGGSALGSAAANYVLGKIESEGFLSHVQEVGDYLKSNLTKLQEKYKMITATKGMGLIQGIQIDDAFPVGEIVQKAVDKGLLLVGAGHQVIRFVPPLIIEKDNIDEMIVILDEVLSTCQ